MWNVLYPNQMTRLKSIPTTTTAKNPGLTRCPCCCAHLPTPHSPRPQLPSSPPISSMEICQLQTPRGHPFSSSPFLWENLADLKSVLLQTKQLASVSLTHLELSTGNQSCALIDCCCCLQTTSAPVARITVF